MEQVLFAALTMFSLFSIILATLVFSIIIDIRFPQRFNTSIIMFFVVPIQFLASLFVVPSAYFILDPNYSLSLILVSLLFLVVILAPALFLMYLYLMESKLLK